MLCVGWQVQVQDVSQTAEGFGRRDNVDLQAAASICTVIALHKKIACTPKSLLGYRIEHDNIDNNHKQL